MRLYSGFFPVRRLLLMLLLCLSSLSMAQQDEQLSEQEQLPFWDQWNIYITELIRRELESPDPWEPLNRKVYAFNDFADRYALTPVAKTYQWVTPDPLEKGIGNVFANLFEVTTIVNDVLQFKFKQALSDSGRLLINSTVGLAGLFDVASPLGLEKHNEDFGQTLGYWGVGAGPYLVVPILGSYTLRDGFGGIADTFTDYVSYIDHVPTRNQVWLFRNIHKRSTLFAAEDLISGDRYSFIRDAYLQRRAFLVNDGIVEDTFGDEDYDEEWDDDDWLE